MFEKLNSVMAEKGLSQRKLASMSGITQQDLNQALNGRKPFFPSWKKKVSDALQISVCELFGEVK